MNSKHGVFLLTGSGRPCRFVFATLVSVLSLSSASAWAEPACTLVVDSASGSVLVRQGRTCGTRVSPASTFKIALSVMGFDSGVLQDAHTPALPYKEEYNAWRESWKMTTDPTRWLLESVVWYSQELTRALGFERFKKYVDAFDYGNRDLSGDPGRDNGLTNAWLSSSLQISPLEEVAFVRKLLSGNLPASPRAQEQTVAIMPSFPALNGWTVYGKTGSGNFRNRHGVLDEDRPFGWFVGWARRGSRTVVFARVIEERGAQSAEPTGFRARGSLLADLPGLLRDVR